MRKFGSLMQLFLFCMGWIIWNPDNLYSQIVCQNDFKDFSEVSLEKILDIKVTSASKHEQETREAPAYVTVITDKMIEAFGYRSLVGALRSVPGMWITSDRYLYQLGIRGVTVQGDWNTRILLLLNGHSLNEQWEGSANLDELLGVEISNVERIEVVRGPGSSLYGSNAFFGVINVITRDAETFKGTRLATGYTYGTNRADGVFSWANKSSNGLGVYLSGSASTANGGKLFFPEYRDLEASERLALEENGYSKYFLSLNDLTGGYTRNTDFLKSHSLVLDINYRDWSLLSKLADRNKGIPSGWYSSVFNTDKNRMEERFNFLELKYQKPFNNKHKFMGRLYYDDYYCADWILYDYFSDPDGGYKNPPYLPGPIWKDEGTDKFWGTELQLDLQVFPNQRLILGGEFQDHRIRQHSGEADKSGGVIENDVIPLENRSSKESIFNLYVQNEYSPIKELNLVLGLHHNKDTNSAGRFTPKFAVLLFPHGNTTFKFLYSRGFRAPTLYERTFDDATYFIGNDKLVPEEIASYELVLEKNMSWARFVTSIYLNEAKKIITQTEVDSTDPAYPGDSYEDVIFQYRNAEKLEAEGIEFSIERNVQKRWGGFLNLAYSQAKDKKTGLRLTDSPELLANLGLNYYWLKEKFNTSLELQYVDQRKAYDGQIAGSYINTNLSVSLKRISRVIDLSMFINNVFDVDIYDPIFEDYYPVVLMKQNGRNFDLRVSFNF